MKFNLKWTLGILAAAIIAATSAVRAQDISNVQSPISNLAASQNQTATPVGGQPSLPAFTLPALTNSASWADKLSGRIGVGYETATKLWCVAGEVEYQVQPNFYAGVGGLFDHYGRITGSVSIGLNGSLNLPKWLGGVPVNLFGGDGIAYDTLKHGVANYFTTGAEVPFHVGKFTIAPGAAVIDLSTRGQIICGGIGMTF